MIVKPNPASEDLEKYFSLKQLKKEEIYIVLAVIFKKITNEKKVAIWVDEKTDVSTFSLDDFDIISEDMPNDWIMDRIFDGSVWILPKEFSNGIWDRFYDADRDAERIFAETNNKIAEFHNRPDLMIDYVEPPITAHDLLKKYGVTKKE